MKLIYIASPYRGDIEKNTEYAKEACKYTLHEGFLFFCPHLFYPSILELDDDIPHERKMALEIGKEMLVKCDELWAFGDTISEGMFEEIECAREHNIEVKRMKLPIIEMSHEMNLC